MDSIIETFHIDWKLILAQAVNFGIVLAVFYFFALKPLTKIMSERAEKIAKGVEDAKANALVLEKTQAEREEVLKQARAEAIAYSDKSRKETESEKVQMLETAKGEVKTLIDNSRKTLEADKQKMVEEAKKEIISLATLAAEKIIKNHGGQSGASAAKELHNV